MNNGFFGQTTVSRVARKIRSIKHKILPVFNLWSYFWGSDSFYSSVEPLDLYSFMRSSLFYIHFLSGQNVKRHIPLRSNSGVYSSLAEDSSCKKPSFIPERYI